MNIIFKNEDELIHYAQNLAPLLHANMVIYLQGDLGAGKTTFVRALLQSLGITGPIKSPTFTLVEPYEINNMHIYHFDFYRISDPEELEYLGTQDYFHQRALCFIEWPERALALLPKPDIWIKLSMHNNGRACEIQSTTQQGEKILCQI